MAKYHVALSFAGEDRTYVERVATLLQAEGIDVFYDLFEEADLWGKNLYTHLSDVYQNKALFTVMFVSEAIVRSCGQIANVRARKLEPLQTAANTYFLRFSTNQSKCPVC